MKKIMRALVLLSVIGLIIFLFNYISTNNMGVLNPKGVIAVAQKDLLITAVSLMMIVIIPVFIMLFSFAWRYRTGNTNAKYTPDWHDNKTLEIIWWTIPIIIISILSVITWRTTHDLDPFKPLVSDVKPITIEVIALDWKWLFIYPEENIATVNYIKIPKDTPIQFKITSDGPMNAFWIPQLGSQIYAMAGMTAKLHLMSHEEGVYKGLSSNFSGDGFSEMKFDTDVVSREEFDEWIRSTKQSEGTLDFERYTMLAKKSIGNKVQYFSSVEENLYTSVIMKYMSNMEHPIDKGTSQEVNPSVDHTSGGHHLEH